MSELIFKISFCACFSYRAALALQITNLLTRAMFASRLNMNDLPAVSLIISKLSSVIVYVCFSRLVFSVQ
jgi:hypothetical protein